MDDVAVGILVTGLTERIEVVGNANEDDIRPLPDLLTRPTIGAIFVTSFGANAAVRALDAKARVATFRVLLARSQVNTAPAFIKGQRLEAGHIGVEYQRYLGPYIRGLIALVVGDIRKSACGTIAAKRTEFMFLPGKHLIFAPDTLEYRVSAVGLATDNGAEAVTLVAHRNGRR